jgi:biotin carboxyl carrier protein
MKYYVEVNGREREVELIERLGELTATVDGTPVQLSYEDVDNLGQLMIHSAGRSYGVSVEGDANRVGITIAGHLYDVQIEDERERAANAAERAASKAGGLVKSLMPGVVVNVLVEAGQEVTTSEPLLILEAMKMQNEITAPVDGVVAEVFIQQGEAVGSGAKLVLLTSPEDE